MQPRKSQFSAAIVKLTFAILGSGFRHPVYVNSKQNQTRQKSQIFSFAIIWQLHFKKSL